MSTKRFRGFTLIELLVVIAIIAILAAILFPVFAQAREKARQATCISNFKEIGLGMMMYVQDYDEFYMAGQREIPPYTGNNQAHTLDWTYEIGPYIKNGSLGSLVQSSDGNTVEGYAGGIFNCPSASNPNQQGQYDAREDVFPSWYDGGTNNLNSQTASGNSVSDSQIDSPAQRIGIWETGCVKGPVNGTPLTPIASWEWYNNGYGKGFEPTIQNCDDTADGGSGYHDCNDYPRYRHQNVSTALYLDGHVKGLHLGTDFYATDLFIPNVCQNLWGTCVALPQNS